jgi:carbonic anhydrase
LLESSLETTALTENGFQDVGTRPGSSEGRFINFLTIRHTEQSVIDDVNRIADHPLIPDSIPIPGFVYDVRSVNLVPVPSAERNI